MDFKVFETKFIINCLGVGYILKHFVQRQRQVLRFMILFTLENIAGMYHMVLMENIQIQFARKTFPLYYICHNL